MIYYSGLGFLFSPVFFIGALPTRATTLFPLPSVQCVSEYRHRTQCLDTCSCRQSVFCFFPFSRCSAWHAGGATAVRPKVTLMETEGTFLCVSSAILWCPPSPFQRWLDLFFSPMLLEPCQHTPLDRDMQIFSIGKQPNRPADRPVKLSVNWLLYRTAT